MPQATDVLGLEAAHLSRLQVHGPQIRALESLQPTAHAAVFDHPRALHVATHGRVRGHRAEIGLLLDHHGQIVGVQLIAPAAMGPVLGFQNLLQSRAHRRVTAAVAALFAPQHRQRVLSLRAGLGVPALDGGKTEAHRRAADRVTPQLLAQPP